MFGISGIELVVIALVALIVFGPKELPKAMRSAGATMRTFRRLTGEYRRQFEQALRDAERDLAIDDTRKLVEAAIKVSPASSQAAIEPSDRGGDTMSVPDEIATVSSEHVSSEYGDMRVKKGRGNA